MGDISTHFSRREFACACQCGFSNVAPELIEVLERIRTYFGRPVYITSGCRCEPHNAAVGGAPGSRHLYGQAADIVVSETPAIVVQQTIEQWYLGQYGIGRYPTHTHIDVRDYPARWEVHG